MLTAAELESLRATQESIMPSSIIIQKYALTDDGQGGFTEAWAAVGTVSGRIYPKTDVTVVKIANGGNQIISETRWYATLPYGSTVNAQEYRLLKDNKTFQIHAVNNKEDYQTAVRCEVSAFNEETRV